MGNSRISKIALFQEGKQKKGEKEPHEYSIINQKYEEQSQKEIGSIRGLKFDKQGKKN